MKIAFYLTDKAGQFVAGVRIRDPEILSGNKPIMLTESEAEHELRSGTIRRAATKPARGSKKKD